MVVFVGALAQQLVQKPARNIIKIKTVSRVMSLIPGVVFLLWL
jgi:hypothetical protein